MLYHFIKKNRPSQRKKYHPFFDYSSDEFYDSSDHYYDSDDDFYDCYTAHGNNDSKETGSDWFFTREVEYKTKKEASCSWFQWASGLPGFSIQQGWISHHS